MPPADETKPAHGPGEALRVAFYAPIKPPDHAVASGDREIARLLVRALARAGAEVEIASRYIAYQKRPSPALFEQRRAGAEAEIARLIDHYRAIPAPQRPALWVTYHNYCKAPDWIGPAVTKALAIPYVTVEACRTRQDSDADWAAPRAVAQAAIRHAAVNLCMKRSDRSYLDEVLGPAHPSVVALRPFLDVAAATARAVPDVGPPSGTGPLIFAAGMMRPHKKRESYRILAEALSTRGAPEWRLAIAGDGPERPAVEALFAFAGSQRVHFLGALAHDQVLAWMRASDLFAWPGHRESIGMVFLEAQANGLPVAATASLGVPDVVTDGETGLLAGEGDAAGFEGILRRLIQDAPLRRKLGDAGRERVARLHSLEAAATTLRSAVWPLAE